MTTSAEQWAREEFGGIKAHAARRQQIVRVAAKLATRPHGKVSASMASDADRQSAYGLLNEPAVTAELLADGQSRAAVRRASAFDHAFVPIDGSAITITDIAQEKGLGRIGSPPGNARGLKVLSAVVVSPAGTPLGVAKQHYWTRSERRFHKNHWSRPIEQRETFNWVRSALDTARLFAEEAPNTKPWFQLDREGDFRTMIETAVAEDLLITIRASHDRRCGRDGASLLWNSIKRERAIGTFSLHVPAGPNRQTREATIVVRIREVTLAMGGRSDPNRTSVTIRAVHAIERKAPRDCRRVEWLLLTTALVNSFDDAMEVIAGYTARWGIEEFHKVWKSGLCHVEQIQLRSRQAIQKMATLLASVAMRAARITHLAREQPDLPAATEFDPSEIDAVIALREPKNYKPSDAPTIGQVVRWIAQIGGYSGSKSSSPPGKIVIGRGLERVETAAQVIRFIRKQNS